MKNKTMKEQKGITLIALVITIIVLIILAGVAITMLSGENGVLTKAAKAKTKTVEQNLHEQTKLVAMELLSKNYLEHTIDATVDEFDKALKENGEENFTVSYANRTNNEDGFIVTKTINGSEYKLIVPTNGEVREPTDVEKTQGKEVAVEEGKTNKTLKDLNGDTITVPAGFTIKADSPTLVDKGIIVVDKKGNEFVWVPVEDTQNFTTLTNFGKGNAPGTDVKVTTRDNVETNLNSIKEDEYDTLLEQYQAEYDAMVASVKKYHGFYVGRYETSWNGTSVASKATSKGLFTGYTDLASTGWKSLNTKDEEITRATWYGLYAKQKELYTKNSDAGVVSGMIYGCQWDAIMNWMLKGTAQEKAFVTNSSDKGNFTGSTSGGTGVAGYDVKNIFDLAGNLYEWTQEAISDVRIHRGGHGVADKNKPEKQAASLRANYSVNDPASYAGTRLQLYVK